VRGAVAPWRVHGVWPKQRSSVPDLARCGTKHLVVVFGAYLPQVLPLAILCAPAAVLPLMPCCPSRAGLSPANLQSWC